MSQRKILALVAVAMTLAVFAFPSAPSRSSWGKPLAALVTGVASAQANPPGALPWGSGLGVILWPCGDDRYRSSFNVVYYGGNPAYAFLHNDFKSVFGGSGYALESGETRCLSDGITLRVRVWIADGWRRVACKYWGDTINETVVSQIHREWCGAI
jgi:hypothetical protein